MASMDSSVQTTLTATGCASTMTTTSTVLSSIFVETCKSTGAFMWVHTEEDSYAVLSVSVTYHTSFIIQLMVIKTAKATNNNMCIIYI